MTGFIGTSITITTNCNSSNQWLSQTSSIPYLATSVFFLRDWLGSDLRIGHLFCSRCPLVSTPQLNAELSYKYRMNELSVKWSQSQSHIATDGKSVSLVVELHLGLMTRYLLHFDSYGLVFVGALSDERTGLSFVYSAGPRQRSLSRVRVPWIWRPYFTLSDLRLPLTSPPTTLRDTVEIFDPASIWDCEVNWTLLLKLQGEPKRDNYLEDLIYYCVYSLPRERVFGEPLASNGIPRLFATAGTNITEPFPSNGHIRHKRNIFNDKLCDCQFLKIGCAPWRYLIMFMKFYLCIFS
jgi:hypothetical protein